MFMCINLKKIYFFVFNKMYMKYTLPQGTQSMTCVQKQKITFLPYEFCMMLQTWKDTFTSNNVET